MYNKKIRKAEERKMQNAIKSYFSSHNIEYYATRSYADCREINPGLTDRQGFVPRSVIIYLLPYYSGETVNLSRYAASLDYHLIISEINSGLTELLKSYRPDAKIKGYGDHSPIDERHAALTAGLGIAGDNGLIINEKYGSFVFIGDIVTDIAPDDLSATLPMPILRCEGCGLCRAACPTGILRGEGDDCLSAITQRKGELSESEMALMRECNTLWGCDLCQTACPHNADPIHTPIGFFHRDRIPHLTSGLLDNMTDGEFKSRAFAWRKRATLQRNLAVLGDKCK